jgi:hypothetical protein
MVSEGETREGVDVRYGRARLTVLRSDRLDEGRLGETLRAYEQGDARPASVARAFLRARVVDHSPSFEWRSAKPTELIPIIGAVSDPPLEATTPKELADELVRMRAQADAPRERVTAALAPVAPQPEPEPAPQPASTAPVAAAPVSPAAPPPKKRRWRLLPRTWKGRIAVVAVVVAAAAIAYGVDYYLSEVPDRLADDYRREAAPAVRKVADAMDEVYAAFDTYLDDSTIPRSELKNVDDYDEIRRRWMPVYDDTEAALDEAKQAIGKANKLISQRREEVRGVPEAPLLEDSEARQEAEAAVRRANRYFRDSAEFLDDFQQFVRFERKALALRRRDLVTGSEAADAVDADLDTYKVAIQEDLDYAVRSRKDHLELKAPPDAERLHELSIEGATVTVDMLEDVKAALNALDVAAYELAFDDGIAELKSVSRQSSRALFKFRADSGLQRSTQKLSKEADRLEDAVLKLGTGNGDGNDNDHYRQDPPEIPPKQGGGSGGDEGSVS